MPGSGVEKFGANEQGEHDWIEMPEIRFDPRLSVARTVCFKRTHTSRGPYVAFTMVGIDIDGKSYVSTHTNKVQKTVDKYGSGRSNLSFHNQRDYLLFMHAMIQAGKRAGFLINDVDVFMTPPEERNNGN